MATLNVDLHCPHTIAGPKPTALRACKPGFPILWVRANDTATLFYYLEGKRKQKTYKKIRMVSEQ